MSETTKQGYPASGADWSDADWQHLLETLISDGIVSWKEVTATILGSLNPSQVGTSIASKKTFQRHFEPRKCWAAVRSWHFLQNGYCIDCHTRLNLQADHAIPKEFVVSIGLEILNEIPNFEALPSTGVITEINNRIRSDLIAHNYQNIDDGLIESMASDLYLALREKSADLASVADRLDNMVLRCRRHNVIRRPSHAKGGQTFLTAEAGLMWLLFVHRPTTYQEFSVLCRDYGLSMANIRFEEAWAKARWLQQAGLYEIQPKTLYSPDSHS